VVVGAGVAGLCVARELALRACRVTLLWDPKSTAATGVAAGLLQVAGGRISARHLALRRACLDYYPEFLSRLGLDFLAKGHLRLEDNQDRRASFASTLRGLGLPARELDACALQTVAGLRGQSGGIWLDDRTVDPQALGRRLQESLCDLAVPCHPCRVCRLDQQSVSDHLGRVWPAQAIVLACGSGLPPLLECEWSFREEKGWGALYRGRTRLEISVEKQGEILVPLPSYGWRIGGSQMSQPSVLQGLDARGRQVWRRAGIRVTAPDGLPLAGRLSSTGAYILGGLGRNGLLTAPLLARGLAQQVATGQAPDWLLPFAPERDGIGRLRPWSK
jgi:glycine/D-amino acid oxidase-like deaminating enzyme